MMNRILSTKSIGERIKALRMEQHMTLAQLGQKTNLSISYLSQIERDKTTPSLSTLTGIAKTLKVALRYFFEAEAEAAFVMRSDERRDGPTADSSITRQCLSPQTGNHKLEIYRVVLKPHTPWEELAPYPGEGCAFVLSGELAICVGDEEFVLAAGDSIHYDALQPHGWSNKGDKLCTVIWSHSASWSERQA
jgi:transcriptional regulator with XRE-family HTH domain